MIEFIIMINNFEQFSRSLPDRVPSGIFNFSFLSWQGNAMTFKESLWMVYLIYALLIVGCLLVFIFKDNVRKFYLRNAKTVTSVSQGLGIFIISLSIFRITILAVGGYPNLWELVPFHFCRLFILLISLSLAFRQINLVKYFSVFAIGGGIMGLLIPDLNNSEYWTEFGGADLGLDSYVFWDYFFIHTSSVFLSVFLLTSLKPVFYKSEMAYTIITMASFTILLFLTNLALANVTDSRWRSNWFYLGIPSVNGIDDILAPFLGPLVSYPAILFTFMTIGSIIYVGVTMIYINSDSIKFVLWDEEKSAHTFKIKFVPSENMYQFKVGPLNYREKYNL